MASQIDWENVWASVKSYRRIILIILGLVLLGLFVAFLFDACPTWFGNREVDKLKQNINAELQNANLVNSNIANLLIENRLAEENVKRLGNDYNAAKNASDEIKRETNAAMENVNRARNANFANTNLSDAQKARCRAFPESADCQ